MEVQGNFTNSATFTSANPSLVKFIGTGASNVTSGTAVFRNVEMAKTANDVVLASNMSIAGDLNFSTDDNQVTLGAFNLNMLTGATVTSPDANEYIATTGAGSLIKNVVGNSTVLHEIGDASNYSPLSSVVTGTGYASATLGARVIDATHPNKPAENQPTHRNNMENLLLGTILQPLHLKQVMQVLKSVVEINGKIDLE